MTFTVVAAQNKTLYSCFNEKGFEWTSVIERAPLAASYGIWNYRGTAEQNTLLTEILCPAEPVLGFSVVTGYQKTLRTTMNSSQSTVPVTSLELKDGTVLTMDLLGSRVFLTLEPGRAKEEIVMCTGITASPAQFTGCTRGLSFSGTDVSSVDGNMYAHGAGSIVVISNVHYVYEELTDKDTNNTTTGNWYNTGSWNFQSTTSTIFNVFPTVSSSAYTGLPTLDGELATKYYVDTVGAGGFTSVNVSTTRGLSVDGSSPEKVGINASSTTGMAFDNDGSLYQKTSSTGGIESNSYGLYIDGSDDITWTGSQTFSNTTTVNGEFTVNSTSTLATTTVNGINLNPLLDGSNADSLHIHDLGRSGATVSSSYALATSYQNTSSQPILVVVTIKMTSANENGDTYVNVKMDENSTPSTVIAYAFDKSDSGGYGGSSGNSNTITFIVPPDYYYRFDKSGNGSASIPYLTTFELQ